MKEPQGGVRGETKRVVLKKRRGPLHVPVTAITLHQRLVGRREDKDLSWKRRVGLVSERALNQTGSLVSLEVPMPAVGQTQAESWVDEKGEYVSILLGHLPGRTHRTA